MSISTRLHGATFQKTVIFILVTVRTSILIISSRLVLKQCPQLSGPQTAFADQEVSKNQLLLVKES
jgi:hypothetical protein